MKNVIHPILAEELAVACSEVKSFLPDLVSMDVEAKRVILQKYTAAIEGNFVSWMGATVICTRSVQGRYAASENLWVEMKDDHAGMLREFAQSAKAEPNATSYQSTAQAVKSIREMVAHLSGLECLTLMATLENTSAVFIPLLEQIARELGSTNTCYTMVHGEADIEHADQFVWALSHEMALHENAEESVKRSIKVTVEFLRHILQS